MKMLIITNIYVKPNHC